MNRAVHEFTPLSVHADACGWRRIDLAIFYFQRVFRTLSWLDYSRVVQVTSCLDS